MWLLILSLSSLGVINVAATPEELALISTTNVAVQEEIIELVNKKLSDADPEASNKRKATWSPEAAEIADDRAKQCGFQQSSIAHITLQDGTICGESLYKNPSSTPWITAINALYDKRHNLRNVPGPDDAVTEHNAQANRYNSVKIGCSVAFCPSEKSEFFYACYLCPPDSL